MYTRVTCVSAALTILREYERIKDSNVAAIWVVPAFTISAAIIILLDLLHKPAPDETTTRRRDMIHSVISGLETETSNVMARRGVKLLKVLLKREREMREVQLSPVHNPDCNFEQEEIFGQSALFQSDVEGEAVPSIEYGALESWFGGSVPYFSSGDVDPP